MNGVKWFLSDKNVKKDVYFIINKEGRLLANDVRLDPIKEKKFIYIDNKGGIYFSNSFRGILLKILQQNDFFRPFPLISGSEERWSCEVIPLANRREEIYLLRLFKDEKSEARSLDSVSFMLCGLAHELKNPLAGIKVLADTVANECENNPALKNYVSRIERNVDRLNAILDVFFSYLKEGKEDRDFISVSSLLEDLSIFFGYRIKREGIDFKLSPCGEDLFIFANKTQVLNLFANLLDNAIYAVERSEKPEKWIEIEVGVKEFFNFNKGCFLEQLNEDELIPVSFRVKDNGIGLGDVEKRYLFNAFFTTKEKGMGLGMSMVLKYVKENCGAIFVESTKGKGTVFEVILPGKKEN